MRLEVHLDKAARNYLFLQKKLKTGADCAAVVKADAYGLGAVEISKALHAQNCRHFFVATFEEGVAVRDALAPSPAPLRERAGGEGIEQPPAPFPLPPVASKSDGPLPLPQERERGNIYVLHGPRGATPEDFTAQNLIPALNSLPDIEYWTAFAKKTGKKQPAVIHIDTGMNRLGMNASDAKRLTRDLLAPLDVRYVMSHLACPDTPDHPKNREQLELFKKLIAETGIPARYSLANSAGILLGEDYHFDLARPGCGIYGINPQSAGPNPMDGVVTLKARILQTRLIDSPQTVGYGAGYKISAGARCATVSAGYADGYFRSLTGHGIVVIAGEKCPVIGRVSMDSIIVDVTALKTEPQPGDWAEIIGPHQTVDEVAAQAGTIGYEVLTALGKRYERIYTGL